jgi:Fe-S cluster assembly iron-binding protein IscA
MPHTQQRAAPLTCNASLILSRPIAGEKGRFDELMEDKGVRILIDPSALMHVAGLKLDYRRFKNK